MERSLCRLGFVSHECAFDLYDRSGEEVGGSRGEPPAASSGERLVPAGAVLAPMRDVLVAGQTTDAQRLDVLAHLRRFGPRLWICATAPPVFDLPEQAHNSILGTGSRLEEPDSPTTPN